MKSKKTSKRKPANGNGIPINDPQPQNLLNVVLHGLFILHVRNQRIELLTPYVDEHKYYAGNWDWNSIIELQGGQSYSLQGVAPVSSAPPITYNRNVVLSKAVGGFEVKSAETHLTIKLPFPDELRPLRILNGRDLFDGDSADLINTNGLPLCQVLICPISNFSDLSLNGTKWEPDPKKINDVITVANLHFWAEPLDDMDPGHAQRAYARLMKLIPPLDFWPNVDQSPPWNVETGVLGLPPDQTKGLSEWNQGEGTRPTNCQTITIIP